MDIRTEIISPANEQYTNSAAGVPGPEAVPLALRAFQEPGGRSRWFQIVPSASRVPWTKGGRYYRELSRPANEQYKGREAAGHSPSGVPSAKARSKSPEGMLSRNKKIPSRKRWDYLVMQKKSVCRIDRLTDGSGTQD